MAPMQPERVAAVVPCHREPPAADLLDRLRGQVGSVLVVDDGMAAVPGRALDRLAAELGLEVFHVGSNLGKGFAIAAGIEILRGSARPPAAVLALDADGQHPPEAIPNFLESAASGELVVGNRFAAGGEDMPVVRRLSNRACSRIVSLSAASPVPDSQCGMRLLHGRALHEVGFPGGGMESETRHLISCLRAGVPVSWVPIPVIYEGEPTSFRRVRDSVAVLRAALAT